MAKTFVLPVSFSTTITLSTQACEYITEDMTQLTEAVRKCAQDDNADLKDFEATNSIPFGRAVAMVTVFKQSGVEGVCLMCVRYGLEEVLRDNWVNTSGDEKFRVSPVKVGVSV